MGNQIPEAVRQFFPEFLRKEIHGHIQRNDIALCITGPGKIRILRHHFLTVSHIHYSLYPSLKKCRVCFCIPVQCRVYRRSGSIQDSLAHTGRLHCTEIRILRIA